MKCLTLQPDHINIVLSDLSWICSICIGCILPFNQVDSDLEFMEILTDFFPSNNNTLCFLSDKLFQPFIFEDFISCFHTHSTFVLDFVNL